MCVSTDAGNTEKKPDPCKRHISINLELGHAKEHFYMIKKPLQTMWSHFAQVQTRPLH